MSDSIAEFGRRQFSVAHELGHWVLHANQTQLLACTEEQILAGYKNSPPELEASGFAACLLMPGEDFERRIRGQGPSWALIRELADYYGVSLTAAAVRFVEIVDDYCALAVCRTGRIHWWRVSRRLEDCQAWLDAKTRVPTDSVAADYFAGNAPPPAAAEVSLSGWLDEVCGIDSDQLMEEIHVSSNYGTVMSLLWIP